MQNIRVAVPTLGQGCSAAAAAGRRCCGAGALTGRRTPRRCPAHAAAQCSTGRLRPRYLLESPRRTATAHCSHAAGWADPPHLPAAFQRARTRQTRLRRRSSAGGGKLRLFRGAPDLYSGSRTTPSSGRARSTRHLPAVRGTSATGMRHPCARQGHTARPAAQHSCVLQQGRPH